MPEIIPAVLELDGESLKSKLDSLPKEIAIVHVDELESDVWVPIDLQFEVHLMGSNPLGVAAKWVERGAKRIIVHKLSSDVLSHRGKVEIGLGVEMGVPLEEVFALIPQADFVQLMSIDRIGAQGTPFDPKVFDRIREVKKNFPNKCLSVDGGINAGNYRELIGAGADRLVVGSGFNDLWTSLTKK